MVKQIALAATLVGVIGSSYQPSFAQPAQVPRRCLHGPSEQPNQRTRREQALKMAQQINQAENTGPALIPSQPKRDYRPFAQLPNMPAVPAGFTLQFHTDGGTYMFLLKDTLDACEYAIFSDQDKGIYEGTPRMGARLQPLQTR